MLGAAPATRLAQPADRVAVAATLTRAFADDPLVTWVFDRAGRRPRASDRFFRWYFDRFVAQGVSWTTPDVAGAAVWALPEQWAPSPWHQAQLSFTMAPAVRRPVRVLRGIGQVELAHPKEPHLYLALLGVDPAAQGRGLGTALVAPGLEVADEERWPAYLETAKERNVAFYGRLGFEVTRRIDMPGGGPPVWLMWRAPR